MEFKDKFILMQKYLKSVHSIFVIHIFPELFRKSFACMDLMMKWRELGSRWSLMKRILYFEKIFRNTLKVI